MLDEHAGPTTVAAGKPASSAPAAGQAGGCEVNPSSAQMPSTKKFEPVPANARISVALSGIPSGTVKPGAPATEVDVTLCNDSPVDYHKVGVVVVLTRCSCAITPIGLPEGTGERFDPATGRWVTMEHPVITTGMDYLGGFDDVQDLPKGKAVTLRYRVSLDASMIDGKGGVEATAVVPDPLVQIGRADLPFTVSKESSAPPNAPAPRQTVLPFTGLTYPSSVAVDAAGAVYLTDTWNDRVLKLAAGSNDQTVLPFSGIESPDGVAVDQQGNVYVTDRNDRVVKLAAGSADQTVLPLTGIEHPRSVAVDRAGNVYVTGYTRDTKVVKLAAGSNYQTVLPLSGIKSSNGVAVDSAGTVYVNDGPNNRVVKLAAGSADQTELPLTGLEYPEGLAVDSAGNVYVVDGRNRQVVEGRCRVERADRGGVDRPQRAHRCGSGWRGQRVRSRQQRFRPGREVGGKLMRHLSAALALLVVAAIGAGCSGTPQSPLTTSPTTASNGSPTVSTAPTRASAQIVLPFTGLENPQDVEVDSAGNVYVEDLPQFDDENGFPGATTRVIKLAAGSNAPTVLPQFVHASLVGDVAGHVWVVDAVSEQLVKLAAGPDRQAVLPLPNFGRQHGGGVLAMDTAGNAYSVVGGGVDAGGGCCVPVHVVKSAGPDAPTVLPFEYVDGLGGIAVDAAGSVYAGDGGRDRVLKLAAGADAPTALPFNHIDGLVDVAVDSAGSVYAVDANHKRVLKLAPGSDTPTTLPFTDLKHPVAVAVDNAGNVYVADVGNDRVLELAAERS